MKAAIPKRPPTILMVDDNPVNVKILEAILKSEGYLTISASNGPDGIKLARTQLPDLILLDIMMPGEDGFNTCSKLKQDSLTTNIPVIFLSALDSISSKVKGLQLGGRRLYHQAL
ncbi:MAG: response regulator [Deltaproteobacteria bacterium]|nr:response regulator [Deltaproteobacteria bacterium]